MARRIRPKVELPATPWPPDLEHYDPRCWAPGDHPPIDATEGEIRRWHRGMAASWIGVRRWREARRLFLIGRGWDEVAAWKEANSEEGRHWVRFGHALRPGCEGRCGVVVDRLSHVGHVDESVPPRARTAK